MTTGYRRPRSNAERACCLRAVAPLLADLGSLPPVVAAIVIATFAAARRDFETGRAAVNAANGVIASTRTARNQGELRFDAAFRFFERTVCDPVTGEGLEDRIAAVLGRTIGVFLRERPFAKVVVLRSALPTLATLPGDPGRLAALAAEMEAFEARVVAWSAAFRARRALVQQLRPVTARFDKAYVQLAEALQEYAVEIWHLLPVFHRKRRVREAPITPEQLVADELAELEDPEDVADLIPDPPKWRAPAPPGPAPTPSNRSSTAGG